MKFDLNTAKNALTTTAVVLLVIYAVRRTTVGQKLVTTALAG